MNKHFFISGIDTDCGKSYITGLLAKNLRNEGFNCITSKFVQTGCNGISEDIIEHRKIMGMEIQPEDEDGTTCPFVYTFPASPHLSAIIDKKPFDIKKVEQGICMLKNKYDIVLTEGAGGVTVPLSSRYLTSDYLGQSKVPLILVSSSKLGSLNHTILSIEYCISKGINLVAVVYNFFSKDYFAVAESTYLFIEDYLNENLPSVNLIHSNDLENGEAISNKLTPDSNTYL